MSDRIKSDECKAGPCSCFNVFKKCRRCGERLQLCYFSRMGSQRGWAGNPKRKRECISCRVEMRQEWRVSKVAEWVTVHEGEVAGFVFEDGKDRPVGVDFYSGGTKIHK